MRNFIKNYSNQMNLGVDYSFDSPLTLEYPNYGGDSKIIDLKDPDLTVDCYDVKNGELQTEEINKFEDDQECFESYKKNKKIEFEQKSPEKPVEINDSLIYSKELPKFQSNREINIFGLLGAGKSCVVNFLRFKDLMVTLLRSNYVLDVDDIKKTELKKQSEIFHKNFVTYVGEIKEQVVNEKENLILNELHLDSEEDYDKIPEVFDLKGEMEKYFNLVIYAQELEKENSERFINVYLKMIDRIVRKCIELNSDFNYDQVLQRIEIVINKAGILENRVSIKKKFEEIKKTVMEMPLQNYQKENYLKIVDYFIENTQKIYMFFRIDKEGNYLDIIKGYDQI